MTEEESASRTFLEGVLYSVATLVQIIVQVATAMYLGRVLGPENYAVYSFSLLPSYFLLTFADMGLSGAILRYSSVYRAENNWGALVSVSKFSLGVSLVSSTISMAVLLAMPEPLAYLLTNRKGLGAYVVLAVPYIAATLVTSISLSLAASLRRAKGRSLALVTASLGRLLATVAFISMGLGVTGAVLGAVLGSILGCIVSIIVVHDIFFQRETRASFADKTGFLKLALSLYSASLLTGVLERLLTISLGYLTSGIPEGNFLAGNFQAASNFLGAVLAIYGSLAVPFVPYISEVLYSDKEKQVMLRKMALVSTTLLMLSTPLSIFTIFFSQDLIRAVYGSAYTVAHVYFAILSFPLVIWPFSAILGNFIQVVNDKKAITVSALTVFISGLISLYVFPGRIGLLGIALAKTVYTITPTIFLLFYTRRRYGVKLDFLSFLTTLALSVISGWVASLLTKYIGLSVARLAVGLILELALYITLMAALVPRSELFIQLLSALSERSLYTKTLIKPLVRYYDAVRKLFSPRERGGKLGQ